MPASKEKLPNTLKRSPKKVQRTYEKTLDSAHEQYGSEERAHRTAWDAVKHVAEKKGDHWERRTRKGPSDAQAARSGPAARRGGRTHGGIDAFKPKAQLYEDAKRAGIEGRSQDDEAGAGRGAREALAARDPQGTLAIRGAEAARQRNKSRRPLFNEAMRRTLVSVLLAAALPPPGASAADTRGGGGRHAHPCQRLCGGLVWSRRNAVGAFELVYTDPAYPAAALPVPARSVPFDADLGPGPDGTPWIVYSRCRTEPPLSTPLSTSTVYTQGRGCRIHRFDVTSGEERPIGSAPRHASDVLPSIWRGRIALHAFSTAAVRSRISTRARSAGARTGCPAARGADAPRGARACPGCAVTAAFHAYRPRPTPEPARVRMGVQGDARCPGQRDPARGHAQAHHARGGPGARRRADEHRTGVAELRRVEPLLGAPVRRGPERLPAPGGAGPVPDRHAGGSRLRRSTAGTCGRSAPAGTTYVLRDSVFDHLCHPFDGPQAPTCQILATQPQYRSVI